MENQTPDLRTLPAMQLAGIRQVHKFTDSQQGIPRQWARFMPTLPLPGQVGAVTYGVIAQASMEGGWFEYMTAAEVADLAAQPEGTGKMRVPDARYAVFTHTTGLHTLMQTWDHAHRWLRDNPHYQDAHTPTFERYDHRFNPATSQGPIEIWLPIQPK